MISLLLFTLISSQTPNVIAQTPSPTPTSRAYTLDELRTQAFARSFESQVEFEHAFQARATAKVSRLNLLPHLSLGSVIAIFTMDKNGLLGAVGDLVPFVLPSRWMQASENRQRSEAENDALVIVKADSGFLVEGLAFSILRDEAILARLNESLIRTTTIRDELAFRERLGQFQPGIHDDVTALVIDIQKSITVLNEAIAEEYAALTQASGFTQTGTISGVLPLSSAQKTSIDLIQESGLTDAVLQQAYELKQIDHLIQMARYMRNERWITWLDPSGDPSGGLGFALPSYISIGRSQINELQVRRTQMEGILSQKLHVLVQQGNLAHDLYQTTTEAAVIQSNRVNRMLTNIRMGATFALSDLISALQDQVKNDLDMTSAQYSYWMTRAALNRLQMSGPYSVSAYLMNN